MVSQYPAHLDRFDQDYLILPDGQCVLGVAYTLAYGYWVGGRIEQWVDRLEARLADEQLTGDRRVNWLLSRPSRGDSAEPADEHWLTVDRFLAGRGWIEEACSGGPERTGAAVRVPGVGRPVDGRGATGRGEVHAGRRGRPVPQRRVDHGAGPVARGTGRPAPSGGARRAQQEAAAQDAYRARLRTRYQRATDAGDAPAAVRYKDLLSAAGASTQ